MAVFTYKAKTNKGQIIEETIQASSREDAASILQSNGLQVLVVKKLDAGFGSIFSRSIPTAEKASLCRFLATMLRAGLSLPESVEIIKQETGNKRLRKILTDISFQASKGESLSSVLTQYKNDFDPVFLTMIKAGEESGTLDQSFDYLAKQLLNAHDLSQKIKGSLMYPVVVIAAMIVNGLIMMVFVLPMISGVFLKMKIELPLYTKIVLLTGSFIGSHVFLVLGIFAISAVSLVLLMLLHSTRQLFLSLLAKIPAVKKLLNQIDVVRFSRTLSTLLKSSVSIIDALDVAADSLAQEHLKKQAKQFSVAVGKGESLSSVLESNRKEFPQVMIQAIKAGEKTGSLVEVLQEFAEFYEKEIDYDLKSLTALLEPVLMLLIGVVVGAMVIIVIAPIYSIIGNLQTSMQK